MTIRELEDEIEKTEKALFASPSLKDWDRLINRYNELKIKNKLVSNDRATRRSGSG